MIYDRIYDDIPPPPANENFEYGYPHSNYIRSMLPMTSGFRRYIAEYTVAKFWRCLIRRRIIFVSALEWYF